MSKNKKALIFIVPLLLVFLAGFLGMFLGQVKQENTVVQKEGASSAESEPERDDTDWEGVIQYEGQSYKKNKDIITILFLGIDDKGNKNLSTIGNGGRSDAMILFLVNKAEETVKMLEISRDTMVEADVYDNNGRHLNTARMHINMQYAYGDSGKKSCQITKNTVSRLLYGTEVKHHFALTIAGMRAVTEALGGITLTMPEDYSMIDPEYTKGAVVTLDGDAVEHFVRYRDTKQFGSNEARMERQNWFLLELFRQMKNRKDEIGTDVLLDAAEPYLETDLDVNMIQKLSNYEFSEETEKVPGKLEEGSTHDEYYVDEEALQALLVDLFYLPAE